MNFLILSILALLVACVAMVCAYLDRRAFARNIADLLARVRSAERLLKQRSDLANEVAHEIKNPITAILCSVETLDLLLGKSIDEAHHKSLLYMKEYGENLLRLVSDFIDVSRAEAGNITARPEATRILPILKSIVGLLESNAQKKTISVKLICQEENLMAFVDPRHLKQIVFNLVHNALKFTPSGGEIRVAATSGFPETTVKLLVTDNGAGIEEERIKHIFDIYHTIDRSQPGTVDAGTGLGLALSKNLIDLAGGEICVRSKKGIGSEFEVKLPEFREAPIVSKLRLDQKLAGNSMYPLEPGEGWLPLYGQKYLLVDMDPGSRDAIAGLIEAWGGMVDKVSQATQAVAAVATKTYDAVVLDDTIDGISAARLAHLIDGEVDKSQTTVIIASKDSEKASTQGEVPYDKWIEKPLNGKVLLESLLKSGKYSVTH